MTSTARAFVGRERELAEGQAVLDEMLEAHGRLLLVAGEPGMGKSRLAEELANRARAGGVRAVWGRCWEAGGAPAYWPWLQSLRSLFRDLDGPALRASLGDGATEIAQLIPDGVPQLWHGYGARTWEVLTAGAAAGFDVRVGLEDVLVLPDGRIASGNAELVATAVNLIHA